MGITLLGSASSFGRAGPARSGAKSRGGPAALLFVIVGFHIEARDASDLALQRPTQKGHGFLIFLGGRRWWRGGSSGGRLQGDRGLCRRALGILQALCRFNQRSLILGAALGLLLFLFLFRVVGERVLALQRSKDAEGREDPRGHRPGLGTKMQLEPTPGASASPSGSVPASC